MRLPKNVSLQQTNLVKEDLVYLSLNLLVQEVFGFTAEFYLIQDQNEIEENGENRYSCKGVSKKHNDLHFGH